MAGNRTIRTLVTKMVLDAQKAFKDLKLYDAAWKATDRAVAAAADSIERNAARAMGALGTLRDGAAAVRSRTGPGAGGGGGRGPAAPRRDPLDAAIRSSNVVSARQAGLAAGAERVTTAAAGLGALATASDRAKAKVADLSAQVERNRKEMAQLREQVVRTGDADGTLAGRMQGLTVKTNAVSGELREARSELRKVDGGLIDAIKSTAGLAGKFDVLKVAAGNLLAAGVTRGLDAVKSGLVGSAGAAMDFEKSIVDVAKVAKDADLTKDGLLDPRIKQGIKDVSKELGVMPTEVAELTAQITAAFSGKTDIVALTSDVTKIGVAWDITGKQAGEYFKQTSAGLQLSADETKALFGSINQLGNELGIKSSEIAEAMTRSAGVLKGANISGETGAALNATLIKAGASAEVAATGVRTFVARLGAGSAATEKQRKAFDALGLSAEAVAKNLSSGDAAQAEAQIQQVVAALVKMGETAPDERMATLIELFGSESIGSIGAAATAVDTLASSFAIAGDKAAALTSVQSEYDRVSNTSAARVEKLKANIGVLAVELGDKLLPHVDRLVNFLTSPEGQEWGARAAATAAEVITGLASVMGQLANGALIVTENLGATTAAIGLLAIAVGALLGPWGLLLTGAVALGSYLGGPFVEQMEAARASELLMAQAIVDGGARMQEFVADLGRHDGVFAKLSDRWREVMLRITGATDALGEFYRRQDAEEVRAGKLAHEEARKRAVDREREGQAKRTAAAAQEDGRRRSRETGSETLQDTFFRDGKVDISGMNEESKRRVFNRLAKDRKTLRPSEKKLLQALSKDLDERIPGGGGSGRGHKATKMDRALAAMDPSLAGVLTAGGERDKGGDLKVHDDVLSRGAFRAASHGAGGFGQLGGDRGSVGPGPSITNNDNRLMVTIQQAIDARGSGTPAENLSRSANDVARRTADDTVRLVGGRRVAAMRNAGGRMV